MKVSVALFVSVMLVTACCRLTAAPTPGHSTEALQSRLREHAIDGAAASRIIACFEHASAANLDTASLHRRLQEGLAKQVAPDALASALEARMRMLTTARRMLTAETSGTDTRQLSASSQSAIGALAHALESGVPADVFTSLHVRDNGRGMSQRFQALIEAAEVLHLAGTQPDGIRRFIALGLDRPAGRGEIIRRTAYWIEQQRAGIDTDTILEHLKAGQHPDGNRSQQRRERQERRRRR